MIRKALLSSVALATFASLAAAADLPSRAPPAPYIPPPPIFTWTGFYIGANVGYAWGRVRTTDVDGYNLPAGNVIGFDPDGVSGGGQIGYNWQFGNFVLGFEGDVGYLGLSGSRQFGPFVGVRLPSDSRAGIDGGLYADATARLGFAMGRWLVFAKGGFAYGDLKVSFIDNDPTGTLLVSGTSKNMGATGYTLGGGVEYALTNNWSLKGEFAYYDFGNTTHTATNNFGVPFRFRHNVTADVIRFGVNYKF